MRTRTSGIRLEGTERIIDKQYRGERIFRRLGNVSQDEAETWLRARQVEIDAERQVALRRGSERLWADGAAKYLIECQQRRVRTLDLIAYHVRLLVPFIGSMPISEVCNEALESFKAERIEDGAKPATVNRSLEVARTVVNRAARVWRDGGKPWISTAPLIEMLDESATARQPRPISWAEQAKLFPRLPAHLAEMAEFSANTGARDENVCGLRWAWEVPVPELGRSVFRIPPESYKTGQVHILVLNDVAWSIVQKVRGRHPDFVFVYRRERVKNLDLKPVMKYDRIGTMNNTGWQTARTAVGLEAVRVHDLRHTFGQRLRQAGVPKEDRGLLMGHAVEDMPEHYATSTVERLVEQANKVSETRDRVTLLQVANG